MAELALAAVIRKTVDILGNLLVDEAARLYWVKEEIGWIETEMGRMQSFLRDLDAKQSSSHRVANLARDVRKLAYDADDIIDTYLPKLLSQNRNFLGWLTKKVNCLPWGSRHKFVMKIEGIRKRVDDINRSRTTYGINENSAGGGVEEWNPRQSFPHVEVPGVVGFQDDINALEARLLDAEIQFCVTSIIGMPGVGKTTLAKRVYNSVKANFQCSAWVYVSQEPKLKDLLQDIARQVGLEKEQREENLEANLYNFLKKKRYVIVIDDIWDVKAWDALKNGIPNICENQSRLVLTSRNTAVGLSVGGISSLHELHPLNPEMSWELFSLFVKTPGNTDQKLMHLGEQILTKCGGLPLFIVTIAGLLSTKEGNERAWRDVLNKMGQEKDDICASSYRDLPTDLKPCFLYFGMFPEDEKILARDLVNLWVAEGFIQSQGRQTLEDAGEDYLNELISRNLIQVEKRGYDGRIKFCRIHDVLHDLCISIAQEEGFFATLRGNDSVTAMELRRAAIHLVSVYNVISSHQFPKLRTLLFFKRKEINHIHKGFRLLRVMYLEGLASGVSLTEMGNLIHLRYLRLSGGLLILPATMGNLKNLQVLDCQECEDLTLLTAIWKMDKLRHVYIPEATSFERQPKKVEEVSLPNLQTLYRIDAADILDADCLFQLINLKTLGVFGSMKQLADILANKTPISEKLEKLQFFINGPYEDVNDSLLFPALNFSCYQNLLQLYLKGRLTKMPIFSRSLTKLILEETMLVNDPMTELGMLPSLRVLKLRRKSYMGQVMVSSGHNSFPSLEILIIELRPFLKALIVEGRDGVMPKLQKVRIDFYNITLDIRSERLKRIFQEFNEINQVAPENHGILLRSAFRTLCLPQWQFPEHVLKFTLQSEVAPKIHGIFLRSAMRTLSLPLPRWQHILKFTQQSEVAPKILGISQFVRRFFKPADLRLPDLKWEDNDFIRKDILKLMEPPTEVANKAKELITDEGTEGEITETPKRFFELGECSSQDTPPT